MAFHKQFNIVDAKTKDVLGEFNGLEAAEKFLLIVKGKGKDAILQTSDKDIIDDPNPGFEIEGLDIIEPENEFGNDLEIFNEDTPLADNEPPPVDEEDL